MILPPAQRGQRVPAPHRTGRALHTVIVRTNFRDGSTAESVIHLGVWSGILGAVFTAMPLVCRSGRVSERPFSGHFAREATSSTPPEAVSQGPNHAAIVLTLTSTRFFFQPTALP